MAWLRLVAWLQAGQGLFSDDAKGFFLFPKGIMVLDVARWWEGNSCWGWELCPPALYPWYMQEVQLVLVGHEPVLDGTWWVLGYNLRSPVFIFAFLAKLQPQMGWSRLNRLLCKLAGRRMFVACYRVLPSCPWWWHLEKLLCFPRRCVLEDLFQWYLWVPSPCIKHCKGAVVPAPPSPREFPSCLKLGQESESELQQRRLLLAPALLQSCKQCASQQGIEQ